MWGRFTIWRHSTLWLHGYLLHLALICISRLYRSQPSWFYTMGNGRQAQLGLDEINAATDNGLWCTGILIISRGNGSECISSCTSLSTPFETKTRIGKLLFMVKVDMKTTVQPWYKAACYLHGSLIARMIPVPIYTIGLVLISESRMAWRDLSQGAVSKMTPLTGYPIQSIPQTTDHNITW